MSCHMSEDVSTLVVTEQPQKRKRQPAPPPNVITLMTKEEADARDAKAKGEILQFLTEHGAEAVTDEASLVTGQVIDVFVPSKKLAIEYVGLYNHSLLCGIRNKDHQVRLDACTKAGLKFLSIYEDEWRDRNDLVRSMITHRLGINVRRFDARKLTLRPLSKPEAETFFEANHLEGNARSTVVFGLLTGDEVVAAMALRRPFHNGNAARMEVARSVVKLGCNVRGWIGRLTKACGDWALKAGKEGLMTYVDARVGFGEGYRQGGWRVYKESTGVRFWWTDFNDRYNRFKHKANPEKGLTQRQVADAAGVVEIYGCTNSMWFYP